MGKRIYTRKQRIERQNNYIRQYSKEHYKMVGMQLNIETQADVIEWLEKQPNKTAAMIQLIRDAIKNENSAD